MSDNPEDDFVEVPATESKVRLGDAAYTGAALSTMFAPGAGVADVMGYAPDPFNPGQMSPSFSENVEQGNYLDAGIQTLGVAGDAMYAMAPFTAGISALPAVAAKGLQAFAKGVKGGEALIETMPNRLLFPDLKFSDVTLRESNIEPGAVDIELLRAGAKGEGLGSETLKRVTERADDTGTTLTLYPSPYGDGGLNQDELIEFYKRNGFEFKYPDPDNPDPILDMVRKPRPTAPKRKYDEFFENMGEEGAGMEFPAIGQAVDSYVTEFDPRTSFDLLEVALKSDDYPGYATVLRANLDRQFPGDKISVSRIENYSDPRAGIEGRRSKSFFEVDKDDVLFAGSDSERELIIRGPKGTYNEGGPMSVRIEDSGVEKKAKGGIVSLLDVARNTGRGPMGVASLSSTARNMNRPMVS